MDHVEFSNAVLSRLSSANGSEAIGSRQGVQNLTPPAGGARVAE